MPKFGPVSTANLAQAHPDLQDLFNEVIKHFDCSVICGHRGEKEQTAAFVADASKVQWPDSKHNQYPSMAVDVIPYPSDWEDTARMTYLAGVVMGIAKMKGISIRWGRDWDSDTDLNDQTFNDYPHFELVTRD